MVESFSVYNPVFPNLENWDNIISDYYKIEWFWDIKMLMYSAEQYEVASEYVIDAGFDTFTRDMFKQY